MTPQDVAEWMLGELKKVKYMDHETTVYGIENKFGKEYTYINNNGNLAIDKRVLAAFRKISEDTVVWNRQERMWRFRENYDGKGRQQE